MSQSPWIEEVPLTSEYPTLEKDIKVDVVIIGGGLTGITAGYLLTKAGKKVAILEKDTIGSGETGYTTAFVTHVIDLDLQDIVKEFDKDHAKGCWNSGASAINLIESIVRQEKIDCEFTRCSAIVYTRKDGAVDSLKEEARLAREFGFPAEYKDQKLPFESHSFLEVSNQAKFHPLRYLTQLTKRLKDMGALIFEKTEVTEIDGSQVKTANHVVAAHDVISAVHTAFKGVILQDKLLPHQTYVIAAKIASGAIPENLYWDTDAPYHYFRIDRKTDHDRIILGGEDHPTGESPKSDPHQCLEEYLKTLVSKYELIETWSGQVIETLDGLPYIGKYDDHYYVGTGYSGNGMTYSAITAMVVSDLILGKQNPFALLYNPRRIGKPLEFIKHGVDQATAFVKDHLSTGEETKQSGVVPY